MPRLAQPLAALRRFARARKGATAVEFAFIALPMAMMIFGVMELALVLLVSSMLDTATEAAARDMRTGVFQGTEGDKAAFALQVCNNMTWLSGAGCVAKIHVEAQVFGNFSSVDAAPRDPNDKNPKPPCWAVPEPGDIALVRTYYNWPIYSPLINQTLVNAPNNERQLAAAVAFRAEPFGAPSDGSAKC